MTLETLDVDITDEATTFDGALETTVVLFILSDK